jgi:protein Tex
MIEVHSVRIAGEMGIEVWQVRSVGTLLEEGATIPFIARYRKEYTDSLDEVLIAAVRDRLAQLAALDKRRQAILRSLEERNLLTAELQKAIAEADTMVSLEDIYLPFRPRRRTRAFVAREKGLEPLARVLFAQDRAIDPLQEADAFINEEKEINSAEDALAGARDIMAEWMSEDAGARRAMRVLFIQEGNLQSSVVAEKDEDGAKYCNYFDYRESLNSVPGHRVLAMFRGEAEGYLRLVVRPLEERALALLEGRFVKEMNAAGEHVALAARDCYRRLLAPSIESDIRRKVRERAEDEAIHIFARNLRQLLLSPPLGRKRVMAIDPGYRTGCKIACLDRQGDLIYHTTIYPMHSVENKEESEETIRDLIKRFEVEAIAIGNGTAGRETEDFIRALDLPKSICVVSVDESGASVYSVSEAAREEFSNYDVTVRGAVSIGRRLMDPLAELVKIDPRSVGVGQYQHDVSPDRLKCSLAEVVVSCVSGVGVEVNTASKQLLAYVSGLGPALGKSIVEYRNQNGPFRSREELKKVPRLGPKAFEQAAGFLRIRDAENPLDATAIHPEHYAIIARMARNLHCSAHDLVQKEDLRQRINIEDYVDGTVGLPTLLDIMQEIARPGRDPRNLFESFTFAEGIESIDHLAVGMRLPGIVTNVASFGAFVDIGVHQDGLVHISEMSDGFVRDPSDVVKLHQQVKVTVLEVNRERKRIALSLRKSPRSRS